MTASSKQPKVTRAAALAGRPRRLPFLRREELGEGRVRVTVLLARSRAAQWLGAASEVERTFGLDALGREVYDACNGRASVADIVRRFAAAHRISPAEAELAVTTFLKTLMSRGLVAMMLEREE